MKKLIIIFALTITSCVNNKPVKHEKLGPKGETFKSVTIDGCQYIIMYGFFSNSNTVIVHKGNCNNPIHHHGI